jgi:2'-5' RNA ligase
LTGDERDAPAPAAGSERVRSFIALPLSPGAAAACGRARDALEQGAGSRTGVRFLPDEALHLTLCFLGYVARDAIGEFARVVAAHARVPPFSLELGHLGAFSSPKRARVVVAELADTNGRLSALADGIAHDAEALGVPREQRAFRPHVTLARLQRPSDVRAWLAHAELEAVTATFTEIRLYESLLHPSGARYSVLARAEFRTGPT